jgi:hypothetical protein
MSPLLGLYRRLRRKGSPSRPYRHDLFDRFSEGEDLHRAQVQQIAKATAAKAVEKKEKFAACSDSITVTRLRASVFKPQKSTKSAKRILPFVQGKLTRQK